MARMLFVALGTILVLTPEWTDAQEQRAIYLTEIWRNDTWVMLGDSVTIEQEVSRISDAAFDLHVFGALKHATATTKAKLDTSLWRIAEDLAIRNKLTPAQQQKLYLAGQGDITRWFDRVEELRTRFQSPVVRDFKGMAEFRDEFKREAMRFRSDTKNLFGTGSLIDKTLNGIRRG